MPSPSHLPPQQLIRHSGAASLTQPAFGALSPQYPPSLSSDWSSQSSLTSHPSAMSTGAHPPAVIMVHPPYHSRPHQPSKVSQPHGAHIPIHPHHHGNQSSVPYRASSRKHSLSGGGEKQPTAAPGNRKQSLPGAADRRQAIYTIQNTLSAVPRQVPSGKVKQSPSPVSTNNPGIVSNIPLSDQTTASVFGVYEPILDRAVGRGSFRDNRRLEQDPDGRIYEVVQTKVVESKINSGDADKKGNKQSTDNHLGSHVGRKTSLGNEVDAKRVRVQSLSPPRLKLDQKYTRSASVHTRPEGMSIAAGNDANIHGNQQNLNSTKSEVLVRSCNKPNSYSRRSYTEPISSNKENCHSNDKSTQDVINRIKKNVERKEEFLKRPNQPIWLPASKPPVIHSDYHVNPQRLPRPLWPPPSAQTPPSPGAVTKALAFIIAPKQDLVHRVRSDMDSTQDGVNANGSPSSQCSGKLESLSFDNDLVDSEDFDTLQGSQHRSLVGNSVPKPYVGSSSEANPAGARYGKGFTTTLSRIQENIPIPEHGSSSSLASQSKQSDTPPGSEKSFMTSVIRPIPLAWVGDNERIKQLQIVSKRAKQFENSKLEKEASGKSAFHRFELTRLSQRSKIPNVAQRKQEFEKRDGDQQPSDDGSGSPASVGEQDTVRLGMNRMIPVGGPHIHCQPPPHLNSVNRPHSDSGVLERERSNSVCSQASMSSLWSTQSMDETNSARQKSVARQNSYLNAVRSPLSVVTPTVVTPGACNVVDGTAATGVALAPTTTPAATPTTLVARRNKAVYGEEGDRLVRRVSYLKATSGDRMYTDSDLDSDNDDRSGLRGVRGETVVEGEVSILATPVTPAGPLCVSDLPSPASLQSSVLRQGSLHVKLTMVDGKRAGDRSWKTVWAVVQGRALIFYKDRQHALQTPLGVEEQISLRGAEVEVASDYTKRRNVLRLATPGGSQLLLQPDTPLEMHGWLCTLQNNCTIQEGEADSKAATTNNNNVSPQTGNKAMRKLTSLRTRSPTGQSPSTKTRKPGAVESNTSPKSKTWKGHLKRPFMRKGHSGSPAATPTLPLPEGATIGVCLEDCPQSVEHECVPLLIALCVSVVETRGLQTQGIYRIPGNKAAVTHLTEMINNDPKCIDYDDPRWCDVNVISSMLKQFFQKLPDPLFTQDLYPLFIEASKVEDPIQRIFELKRMVHELPDYHYETLRFLILHLSNIVSHSDNNKMDVRNLAIVFGPTLVRSGDDNMVTMVTDMSHQCRIIESLISHANWFFADEDGDELSPPMPDPSLSQSPTIDALPQPESDTTQSSQALLLHNIQKVEAGNIKADMKKDIVSSIISAANRKVHKVKHKKQLEEKPVDDSKYSDKEGGFEERDIDKEAELRKQQLLAKHMESMVELPDPKPMSERKISNMSLMSVQSQLSGVSNVSQTQINERTSGVSEQATLGITADDSRLLSVVRNDGMNDSPVPLTLPSVNTANSTQHSSQLNPETSSLFGDEVAIRSYAGLSASTQERIRRFKMETLAMLHRDVTRHRRETERRDVERQRLEELWHRAKQDMESEDILDQLADNPTEVVRKISDYPWRLQSLSEGVGGERGSVASSTGSHLISAALSHHPLSNTSLTPTTNAISQVPNNHLHPPMIKVANDPTVGKACDSTNETRHGMLQQNSLAWLDYNAASPHNTLGSTSSSGSSGYGSLTRSSHANNPIYSDDMAGRAAEEAYSTETCRPRPFSVSQQSSPSNSKKKKSSKGSGFLFGLTSSSSSPSLFPSMAEAATELTPTRKIGQTTIYPESPRPPPHRAHPSSQSHLNPPILIPHPNAPPQGRHKDSILHHILPSRLYHSPRPLRRGSSAESVTEQPISTTTTTTLLSPSIFDSQKVVNNGTLRRARATRDQMINGPETGVPRCGSLDSLRDSPHVPHDDGSDLLSAITATFEEKMRSLQESPLGLVASGVAVCPSQDPVLCPAQDPSPLAEPSHHPRGNSACRLYRDPSLHRRRTNPRNATTADLQLEDLPVTLASKNENDNKILNEEGKKEVKVKRSDSLTKSEKTENNLKEKTEKRARELKRTDTQDSLSEKKPKEMKRSDQPGGTDRSRDPSKKSEGKDGGVGSVRRTSDLRSRRHNVKELKEKFEQNTASQSGPSAMKPSNGVYSGGGSKVNKSATRRTNHRGPIKRRHTVGGTKDLAKWAWVHSGEGGRSQTRATRLTAWERLQPMVADERLNTDRSLEAWLAHERIRTSSPDLSRPQQLVLSCHTDDKENLHRRLSVQEATLNPLYPVLESHV